VKWKKRKGEKCHGNHLDHHLGPPAYRRPAHLGPQQVLGTLSQRRNRIDPPDFDHPIAAGANLTWFLLHRGGKLEDFSITWFCDRALMPGRKIQDTVIHPRKEIRMIKLGKSVMAALVMSALMAGLFCCQKKEGPVERAGKQVDKAVEKAGQQIEKAGEKIEDAAKDAVKK